MANQFMSGTEAIARVRFRSDTVGLTTRHTDTDILAELNLEFRNVRELVSSEGVGVFLEPTASAALPTTPPTALEQYAEIDWPTNITSVHKITVLQSGVWHRLKPADFAQIEVLSNALTRGWLGDIDLPPAPPFWWSPRKVPQASGATPTVGKIQVFPLPQGAQSYRLWGLEAWSDIVAASVFPGHSNWHTLMIANVAKTLVTRDNNAQGTLDGLTLQSNELRASIIRQCRLLQAGEAIEPADIRSSRDTWGGPRMIP